MGAISKGASESKFTENDPPLTSGETCAAGGKGYIVVDVMREPRAGYTCAGFIREAFLAG